MSISSKSHVEFKKRLCHSVDFKDQGLFQLAGFPNRFETLENVNGHVKVIECEKKIKMICATLLTNPELTIYNMINCTNRSVF